MFADTDKYLQLPAQPRVVADARRAVTAWCRGWELVHLADSVELLVSEMVTNAVVHGIGPVQVHGAFDGSRIRVEVQDNAAAVPEGRVTAATELDEHGRGLQLIAMLADSWGTTPTPTGKTVWIELAAAGPPPLP